MSPAQTQTQTQSKKPVHISEPFTDQENPEKESPRIQKPMSDAVAVSKRFPEPRVRNLLVLAVDKVISDTGLVLISPGSGQQIDRPRLPYDWTSSSPVILCYSLPQLLSAGHDSGPNLREVVFVTFETLSRRFLEAKGALLKRNSISNLYTLYLDKHRFEELLVARCSGTRPYSNDDSLKSFHDKRVSHFWKIVKDELALPLLIDLASSTGLPLPPCLMSLPPDLKLRILELLSGTDIVSIACVCSEMRDVASDDYLWKKKVEEEFEVGLEVGMTWKETFRSCWESWKKKRKRPTSPRVYRPSYRSYMGGGPPAAAVRVYRTNVVDDGGIWL